jgi:glycosyltransferase involved in cell wall biosynthesis
MVLMWLHSSKRWLIYGNAQGFPMTPKLSIILPVYNQADHIEEIVSQYQAALSHLSHTHEMILVVNGSKDKSLEVCQSLAQQDKSINVLHSPSGGWGLAVRMGIQHAQGEFVCYTNSARTEPKNLVLFCMYSLVNNCVIKANRKNRDNWQRRLGSLLYNILCRVLFDLSYWDINGTPKVFPRRFDKLLHLTREDDLIDLEFNMICQQEEYPLLEVPVFTVGRHGGLSTTSYQSAWRMYIGAYNMWRSVRKRLASV